MNSPDFFALAAQTVHGLPDDWAPRVMSVQDRVGYLLSGACPVGAYQRGPRKGQPKYPPKSKYQTVAITFDHLQQAKDRWEAETGLCHHCLGKGQEVFSISIKDGCTYRPCRACNGTGKAKHLRSEPNHG